MKIVDLENAKTHYERAAKIADMPSRRIMYRQYVKEIKAEIAELKI